MNENKFIKILRLIVMLASFSLCAYGAVSLTQEAVAESNYWLFLVVAACLGAMVSIVINFVNIFKNWDFYWKS